MNPFLEALPEQNFATITLLSIGDQHKVWALSRMYFGKKMLAQVPNTYLVKMLGTSHGFSYKTPNLQRFGIFISWRNKESAVRFFQENELLQQYRLRGAEEWSVGLVPFQSRGLWSGVDPFFELRQQPEMNKPIAILTRASIKPLKLWAFWRLEPEISRSLERAEGLVAAIGMGEVPVVRQVTFSLWQNERAMLETFAQKNPHQEAAKSAFAKNYFSESLFTRLVPVCSYGTWNGSDPVANL